GPISSIVNYANDNNIYYDVDNYSNPLYFGRTVLYTNASAPITNITFQTYAPVLPLVISGNYPGTGQSAVIYPSGFIIPSGLSYSVFGSTGAVITSYATWNNIQTIPISQSISIQLASNQY